MSKYAWCSDIHLDHLSNGGEAQVTAFANSLIVDNPAGIFITGDISNAKQLVLHMSIIDRVVKRPVYFVLGNHDFYGGDIEGVRKSMHELSNISAFLKYMPTMTYVGLSPSTAVVGADGWYDAQNGDWQRSRFLMTDWEYIHDFVPHSGGSKFMATGNVLAKGDIVTLSRKLAREGVIHIMEGIKSAARYHRNIVVLTHVPPFPESHIFQGNVGDSNAQPWFTNKFCGDMLMDAARSFPAVNFTVLCGHTHGKYEGSFAKNLKVQVAWAEYGQPNVAGLIDVA